MIDKYDACQNLLDYWAETYRIIERDKNGQGWTCDLVPKSLIVARYFAAEQVKQAVMQELLAGRICLV